MGKRLKLVGKGGGGGGWKENGPIKENLKKFNIPTFFFKNKKTLN